MDTRFLPVPEGLAGGRADSALSRLLGMSRSRCAELLDTGQVTSDGKTLRKSDLLVAGQLLEIIIPPAPTYEPEVTPVEGLETVYDDDDLVVINKPAGVAAHTGPGWSGPTVVGALRAAGYRISTSGPVEREGIVHRLDAGTSGLMIVAKSELAYGRLKNMFRYHRVRKIYHALVQGHLDPLQGTIDAPIGRSVGKEFKMCVAADGKASITHYECIELMPRATLAQVELETGRTHQIRVHFSALNHPCMGDTLYGADPALARRLGLERQWLHAVGLEFEHPRTGQHLSLHCEYAPDLLRAIEQLRGGPELYT